MVFHVEERNQFIQAKNGLLRYYSSVRASHTTHLIGFTAGLFTLVQVFLQEGAFHEMFFNLSLTHFSEIAQALGPYWVEIIKFGVFFSGVWVLFSLIIRSIFRYGLYATFSHELKRVSHTKVKSNEPVHEAIHEAVQEKTKKQRILLIIPLKYFLWEKRRTGHMVCVIAAFALTLFLIMLLW
jgi:hypothetical protein